MDQKIPNKFQPATSDVINLAQDIIVKDSAFKLLKNVKIYFAFRHKPKFKKSGEMVLGECIKIPAKYRDLFHFDFLIEIFKPFWLESSEEQKRRLLWHELFHCGVEVNSAWDLVLDDCGRVKIFINPHDIEVEAFEEEIKKFGLTPNQWPHVIALSEGMGKKDIKEVIKKKKAKVRK